MYTYPEQQKLYMPYRVKGMLSRSLSRLPRNASTGCAVTSMTVRYHELGQVMGGRGPGAGSHVVDVCMWPCEGGVSGTACHVLGGQERRDGCAAALWGPLWRHSDNWVTESLAPCPTNEHQMPAVSWRRRGTMALPSMCIMLACPGKTLSVYKHRADNFWPLNHTRRLWSCSVFV